MIDPEDYELIALLRPVLKMENESTGYRAKKIIEVIAAYERDKEWEAEQEQQQRDLELFPDTKDWN